MNYYYDPTRSIQSRKSPAHISRLANLLRTWYPLSTQWSVKWNFSTQPCCTARRSALMFFPYLSHRVQMGLVAVLLIHQWNIINCTTKEVPEDNLSLLQVIQVRWGYTFIPFCHPLCLSFWLGSCFSVHVISRWIFFKHISHLVSNIGTRAMHHSMLYRDSLLIAYFIQLIHDKSTKTHGH
jgi:hypothetical protein